MYTVGAGAAVVADGKFSSLVSKHFFLCSFSCFGILTSFELHFRVGTALHSYDIFMCKGT